MPILPTSRYHALPVYSVQGRLVIGQRPAPAPQEQPSIVHVLCAGETLDLLAKRFYGREDLWWRIADANPRRFPLDYRPGDTVTIPLGRAVTERPIRRRGT